jgi:hypothetical protein
VATLDLVTVAFNQPRLIEEQIRLLREHLAGEFELVVLDNSSDQRMSAAIKAVCEREQIEWWRPEVEGRMHHAALNAAGERFSQQGSEFFGFLDHDVFPTCHTSVMPYIQETGFFGIGQRTPGNGKLYLWPGFCFFSSRWLRGRRLNFGGADGGDTASALWPLFAEEDWKSFYRLTHGYRAIRSPDSFGLQSWGYEQFGDWIHFTNGSKWMQVPDPDERERILMDVLATL